MNWRRGSFRIWVIASAAWLVIAAVISVNLIREVSAPVVVSDGDIQITGVPGNTPLPVLRKRLLAYIARKSPAFDPDAYLANRPQPAPPPTRSSSTFSDLPKQTKTAFDLSTARPVTDPAVLNELNYGDKANAIIGTYQPRSYWAALGKSIALILLPPLTFFAMGAAAFWVLAGFKTDAA